MRMKGVGCLLLLTCLLAPARMAAQNAPIDLALAQQYFQEAQAICKQDEGRLWGISLCGPVLFVEPETRTVVANQQDAKGLFTRRGEVFVGHWPDEENCANTAIDWAGTHWTMIIWPLPQDEFERRRLLMHELFHRVQAELKLPLGNPANAQLDTRDGRLWLQLEWRALSAALNAQGGARRQAAADALAFRAYRHSLFPQAQGAERALEMNEGLAEYTGVRLAARDEAQARAAVTRQIERAHTRPTFVRSFAYVSGPAYGLLLDAAGAPWRKGLTPQSDLGALLQRALAVKLPTRLQARAAKQANRYEGRALMAAEDEREHTRRQRLAAYRARLVEGPRLLLSLTEHVQYSFNPNELVPLDGAGTVYPTLRVTDEWGILAVENGALMTRAGERVSAVYIKAPADLQAQPLKGDGWILQLNDGWRIEPGERKGDYVLRRASAHVP